MSKDANQTPPPPEEHPNHFVREWREFMQWSQEELGAMVDVHQSKIARVESGKRELKTSFLRQLATAFGVPPSALLEVNPSTESGKRTASMLLAWNKLTPSQQGDMLRMMRALSSPNDKPNAG